MTTEIPGYIYSGDVSVADYGGKWIGIGHDNLGHVIEVVGAADLGTDYAIITSGQIYVRGHNEMREAMHSAGWISEHTLGPADRDIRRAMLLEAFHGHWGADVHEDYGGRYEDRVESDEAAIAQANRWAR